MAKPNFSDYCSGTAAGLFMRAATRRAIRGIAHRPKVAPIWVEVTIPVG